MLLAIFVGLDQAGRGGRAGDNNQTAFREKLLHRRILHRFHLLSLVKEPFSCDAIPL